MILFFGRRGCPTREQICVGEVPLRLTHPNAKPQTQRLLTTLLVLYKGTRSEAGHLESDSPKRRKHRQSAVIEQRNQR